MRFSRNIRMAISSIETTSQQRALLPSALAMFLQTIHAYYGLQMPRRFIKMLAQRPRLLPPKRAPSFATPRHCEFLMPGWSPSFRPSAAARRSGSRRAEDSRDKAAYCQRRSHFTITS